MYLKNGLLLYIVCGKPLTLLNETSLRKRLFGRFYTEHVIKMLNTRIFGRFCTERVIKMLWGVTRQFC